MAPLTLRDFLELACESSSDGFRSYPRCLPCDDRGALAPVRLLIEADLRRSPSWSPSSFFSPKSPGALAKISHLSRSLSRRLREGFWRRREEEEAAAAAAAVSSCNCGCSSDSETSESSNSTERKSESDYSSASSESLHAGVAAAAVAGDEHEAMKRESEEAGSSSETDDKEQLSPVAVMDFPFDDDDGEDDEDVVEEEARDAGAACSPSFSDSLAQLQGRKMQPEHRIRRFGSIGELGPVDLEARVAASECDGVGNVPVQQLQCCTDGRAPPRPNGHEKATDEYSLLALLTDTVSAGVDDVSERLLLDFFVETKRRPDCTECHAPTGGTQRNGEAARLAKGWLEGAGARWGLKDVLCRREKFVAEMERSRRWMRVGEEEREVGVVVAGLVIDELVDELVRDLAV